MRLMFNLQRACSLLFFIFVEVSLLSAQVQCFHVSAGQKHSFVGSRPMKVPSQLSRASLRMELKSDDPEFIKKIRLREETEYPFRKIRMFLFGSSIASATVGLFISSTRLLAKATGIQGPQETTELLQNIGIDLGVIVICAVLLRNDFIAQAKILERLAQGARIAGLRVRAQFGEGQKAFSLADFRRDRGQDKRLAIFVGSTELVQESLASSNPLSERLIKNDLLAIPVAVSFDDNNKVRVTGAESTLEEALGQKHVALPTSINLWQEWVESEVEVAQSQGIDVAKKGLTFIIKKNGRVGQRAVGCPPWQVFIGDVENRASAGLDVTNI
mmetsp:Transcript_39226/g.50698  ORF Transcript_39226/g.50698 Transcript_39226/m.50698 type:complete len:329 (+) Transcript_39226:125-1111(+)